MTMPSGELAKAKITNLSDKNNSLTCMFNPNEYSFTRTNTWTPSGSKGNDISRMEFGGGNVGELTLNLLFDTNEKHTGNTTAGRDVRDFTKKLWDMMKITERQVNKKTGRGSPPIVRFEWGSLWSFDAVITAVTERFTLFRPDGKPVRAEVKVTFKQIKAEGAYPKQNPSSGGNPGEHVRTVVEGETLAGIAFEEYGDATVWRHLAEINNINNPRRLRPGQVLLITPLPS